MTGDASVVPYPWYDLDPQQFPLASQVLVQRRPSQHDEVELSAKLLVDPAEQKASQGKWCRRGYPEKPVPEGFPSLPFHLPLNSVHQQLQRLGDEKHDGYPALTHHPRQNGRLAAGRVGDTGTMVQHDEL